MVKGKGKGLERERMMMLMMLVEQVSFSKIYLIFNF